MVRQRQNGLVDDEIKTEADGGGAQSSSSSSSSRGAISHDRAELELELELCAPPATINAHGSSMAR